MKSINILRIVLIAALFVSVFFVPAKSQADLVLPTTICDGQQVDATLPGFGVSAHLTPGMIKEDGTRAFSYGSDNHNFVSVSGNKILFDVKLLFIPDNPNAVIKLYAFDQSCNILFGFGPVFFNLNTSVENIASFDKDTYEVLLNGGELQIPRPSGIPRYIWVEVSNGLTGSDSIASYSYLVDVNNPVNPSGEVISPLPEPAGKRPVLIIPGIMGTELYDNGELIWPNVNRLLTSFSDDFLSNSLGLDSQGNSVKNINVGNVIEKLPATDTFESLISLLKVNNYNLNQNLYLFPYDWRIDIDTNKILLKNKIDEIKTQTGFFKINVVAHSMGGLLVEDYIKQYGTSDVDKLIYVGTPHLGAPKAVNSLLAGNIGVPLVIVNSDRIKEISKNSPSVYELLPNQKYFDVFQGYLKPMPSNGNSLNYSDSKEFLSSIGKNTLLINQAQGFFNQQLQDLDYGSVQVFNITGCKTGTQAFYNVDATNGNVLNTKFSTGDGTVPFISADYSSGIKYYVRGGRHSSLPSMSEVKELILDILTSGNEHHASTNVSRLADFCQLTGKVLNFRSPVTVQIYDALGNHSGPLDDGTIENNIPGVEYDMIDGEAYIFLPTDEEQTYSIQGTGTANSSFDLIVSDINNDQVTSNALFDNVHITAGSSISLTVSQNSDDSNITVDNSNTPATNQSANQDELLIQAIDSAPFIPTVPSSGGGGGGGISYLPPAPTNSQPEQNDGKILGEKIISRIAVGTLVLDSIDLRTVYLIGDHGKKYGFTSEVAFKFLGFSFKFVILADLSNYELGGLIY